jgi:hypothetical protein
MNDLPGEVEAPWQLQFQVLVNGGHYRLAVQPGDALQMETTAQTNMLGSATHREGERYSTTPPSLCLLI